MKKELLSERFKELAGIKSFESVNEEKDEVKEKDMMNESIFGAVAGIMGLFGAAGVMVALEQAAEDEEFKAKHPKAAETLTKIFGFLRDIGGAAGSAMRREGEE
mgnify:CR=1 FL=1